MAHLAKRGGMRLCRGASLLIDALVMPCRRITGTNMAAWRKTAANALNVNWWMLRSGILRT